MKEVWRDVVGHDGYQVSNFGNVRSYVKNKDGKDLKFIKNKQGYNTVCLRRGNRRLVHRLVADAFIPNPDNLPLVRHMDDNPSNNRVDNLAWGTQTDNMQDCVRHGRLVGDTRAAIESKRKMVIATNLSTGEEFTFISMNEAARELDLWVQHISRVVKGEIKQTGGWSFRLA